MILLGFLSIISLMMSFVNFFLLRSLINELKSDDENSSLVQEENKPESHLAERLHELQTMKFSDMRRRYK